MLNILTGKTLLALRYLYIPNLKLDFVCFFEDIFTVFSSDWTSTSVICFGVCELTIRVTCSSNTTTSQCNDINIDDI
ncbi:hypothetical protein DICVIV_13765 [Dictyocaulus viviparus]|uniref:Uncharacterized protein n=1 Tax=Dictyocaulus viviparus TaxID=29172 RepID=A0A0D8X969_DICVI|nr:hypothetical protein DICVIV_13765 [Dictyocaulus viviparus]